MSSFASLTIAEADRLAALRTDRRTLRGRKDRYERLANEYRAMQAEVELTLAALETEIRDLARRCGRAA